MSKKTPTLFLHGGPGLSSIAERELYGAQLPVHWWDQPNSVVLFAKPYRELLDAAEDEASQLAEQSGGRINLLAHSFGANLALQVVERIPSLINEVTLLAPVRDMGDAFIRLSERLRAINPDCEQLTDAMEEFRQRSDFDHFARLATQVMAISSFIDLYRSSGAEVQRRWFVDLLMHQPLFDSNAFAVVVKDFWAEVPASAPAPLPVRAHLVFGTSDPLVCIEAEQHFWASRFHVTSTRTVDSGHFVHLERPPAEWWAADWPR
jgi:pimeloyl-ACP methyl ester carboxylesterase